MHFIIDNINCYNFKVFPQINCIISVVVDGKMFYSKVTGAAALLMVGVPSIQMLNADSILSKHEIKVVLNGHSSRSFYINAIPPRSKLSTRYLCNWHNYLLQS